MDVPLREQDSYDSDDISPATSPSYVARRRKSVDSEPSPPRLRLTQPPHPAAVDFNRSNALDGMNLTPLLLIPWGFGVFAIGTEYGHGNWMGAAAALWWHVAFWVASVASKRWPVFSAVLCASALLAPLRFEQDAMVIMMHSMAWITHALRLATMINEPAYFDHRDWRFRILFVHYYHDIRGASVLDSVASEVQYLLPGMLIAVLMVTVTRYVLHNHVHDPAVNEIADILEIDHRLIRFSRYVLVGALFGFSMSLLDSVYRLPLALVLGVSIPSTFRDPHRSRTLAEFWGKRWNLVIRNLLAGGVFKPLVKLTGMPALARLATFAASGVLHVVPLAVTGQDRAVFTVMFAFFVIVGVLTEVEKVLLLKGQAWLAVVFLVVSPLFWEPLLIVLRL